MSQTEVKTMNPRKPKAPSRKITSLDKLEIRLSRSKKTWAIYFEGTRVHGYDGGYFGHEEHEGISHAYAKALDLNSGVKLITIKILP